MKKGWKIALISVGSLLGVVLLVVAVAMWVVFTPKQLTKVVNKLADNYLLCDASFGNVDLTLLSTFPDAGLRVDDVVLLNPQPFAPTDTVAQVKNLTIGIDVKAFLKGGNIKVHKLILEGTQVALYTDIDGTTNFDIFPTSDSPDTTQSTYVLPDTVDLKQIKIKNLSAIYASEKDGLEATLNGLNVVVDGSVAHLCGEVAMSVDSKEMTLNMADSAGNANSMVIDGLNMKLKGEGSADSATAMLQMELGKLFAFIDNDTLTNTTLIASKESVLKAKLPLIIKLNAGEYGTTDGRLSIDRYAINLQGSIVLPDSNAPMYVDAHVATTDEWNIKSLLAIVPARLLESLAGMNVDGNVSFDAVAKGYVSENDKPVVDAGVRMTKGKFAYPQALPYNLNDINADIDAHLDLLPQGDNRVTVNRLNVSTRGTSLSVTGVASQLLDDIKANITLKGSLPLRDIDPLLPDTLPIDMNGRATINATAQFVMSQLQNMELEKMRMNGTLALDDLNVVYDSIEAATPHMVVNVALPSKNAKGMLADATIEASRLNVVMTNDSVRANLESPNISLSVNNPLKKQLQASFDISLNESEVNVGQLMASLGAMSVKGAMQMDSMQNNILRKFHPEATIDMHSAVLYTPAMPDAVRLSQLSTAYNAKQLDIDKVNVKFGHSDFSLYGTIENAEAWLSGEQMLTGHLDFTSSYTDADQLMTLFSGMGSDADSIAKMNQEDHVPADATPFHVPKNVNVAINTHIKRCIAFGNDLNDVAGTLTINDGKAVLEQMGFVCKAATMQLTAVYESPRPNNLFTAIDFHLLDIQIDELIDMIPSIDTLVPMLSAFEGAANFHLAAETFLNARYEPKMSSLLGSAAISGKNLVVMDNKSISNIAKLMQLKSWKENDNKIHIDSLDVEMTCFRKEIEVYPFLLNVGNYRICASGKHNLDNLCSYHVELLKHPLLAKIGVDVKGSIDSPKITLGEVKYSDLYKPEKQGVVEKRTLEMKERIRRALEANVR